MSVWRKAVNTDLDALISSQDAVLNAITAEKEAIKGGKIRTDAKTVALSEALRAQELEDSILQTREKVAEVRALEGA